MLNFPTRGGKHNCRFVRTVHVPADVNRAPYRITSLPISVFQSLRRTPLILRPIWSHILCSQTVAPRWLSRKDQLALLRGGLAT